jgi:hypothetical protein
VPLVLDGPIGFAAPRFGGALSPPTQLGVTPRYSRTERGTRVAAQFYSLIESAKLAGVEPRGYLGEPARQAIRNPGTVTLARDFK